MLKVRFGDKPLRGYWKKHLIPVFNRYLSSAPPVQSVTPLHRTDINGLQRFQSVTQKKDVTLGESRKVTDTKGCNTVTLQQGVSKEKERKKVEYEGEDYIVTDKDLDEMFNPEKIVCA